MSHQERDKVSDALKEQWFNKGEYVIREGESGNRFYIIEEGSAVATKTLSAGSAPTQVKSYTPGTYFGERALLTDEPRAANIIATSD